MVIKVSSKTTFAVNSEAHCSAEIPVASFPLAYGFNTNVSISVDWLPVSLPAPVQLLAYCHGNDSKLEGKKYGNLQVHCNP